MSDILNKIEIRRFKNTDDINELTFLLNNAYKKLSDKGFKYLASHQDAAMTKKRMDEGACFVVLLENKIIATITYYSPKNASGNEWYNQDFVASYGQFAVAGNFQSIGLGSKLIEFIEQLAKEDNSKEISIDTAEGAKELISFYSKRDYKFVGYAQWEETNYRSVILSKKLH